MNILLAVDGSPFTQKMLTYLVTHPEWFGGHNTFTVFTAVAALPPRVRAAVGADVAQGYYDDEAAKVAEPVTAFLARHAITPTVAHQAGPAGELIAKAASEGGFDLVVMNLPKKLARIVNALVTLLTLSMFALLFVLSFDMIETQIMLKQETPALGWPEWVISLAITVGAFFCFMRFAQAGWNAWKQGGAK